MITHINTENDYRQALVHLEVFLQKGFSNLLPEETLELEHITKLIKGYENIHYSFPIQPQNLIEMIELRMFQEHLNQKGLSKLLGVTETRLSEVLKGRRKVNLDLAKKLYENLKISADFILQSA